MSEYNRLDAVEKLKQELIVQTDELIKEYVEYIKASEYSKSDPNDIKLYVDYLHYAYILRDYLTSSWAFMQYSFMDEDYGYTMYDISDELIEYMCHGEILAIIIIETMVYKKPWYGPIDDRFINNHVLTVFHRMAANRIKVKGNSK